MIWILLFVVVDVLWGCGCVVAFVKHWRITGAIASTIWIFANALLIAVLYAIDKEHPWP